MDTQGNLFNFYNDVGGERKITPVGNISDLKAFKVGARQCCRCQCPQRRHVALVMSHW